MHWSRDYLGLPYEPRGRTRAGVDCWGLPCLVYADRLGIALPSYADTCDSVEERAEAEALFRGEFEAWREVDAGDEREHDLAWFRSFRDGLATHVGVVLRPGLMLHADNSKGGVVCTQDYASGAYARNLIGFRRHRQAEEASCEA